MQAAVYHFSEGFFAKKRVYITPTTSINWACLEGASTGELLLRLFCCGIIWSEPWKKAIDPSDRYDCSFRSAVFVSTLLHIQHKPCNLEQHMNLRLMWKQLEVTVRRIRAACAHGELHILLSQDFNICGSALNSVTRVPATTYMKHGPCLQHLNSLRNSWNSGIRDIVKKRANST